MQVHAHNSVYTAHTTISTRVLSFLIYGTRADL